MNIVRWRPLPEMVSLRQAMDRLFEDSFVTPHHFPRAYGEGMVAPIDMYQTEGKVVVKAALPGLKPEDVDITISDGVLTIKGETKADEEVKREEYIYQEHRYGAFSRSVALPEGVNADKADAGFDDGVLTLTIPRAGEIKPKQIKVRAKAKKADNDKK